MAKKTERAKEAAERVREALKDCGPDGQSTIEIRWVGGGPTPYGRTDYYDIRVWSIWRPRSPDDKPSRERPSSLQWLTRNFCWATRNRFNEKREAVSVSGCGYSKPHQLATELGHIAGHPIYVEGAGVTGWFGGER